MVITWGLPPHPHTCPGSTLSQGPADQTQRPLLLSKLRQSEFSGCPALRNRRRLAQGRSAPGRDTRAGCHHAHGRQAEYSAPFAPCLGIEGVPQAWLLGAPVAERWLKVGVEGGEGGAACVRSDIPSLQGPDPLPFAALTRTE